MTPAASLALAAARIGLELVDATERRDSSACWALRFQLAATVDLLDAALHRELHPAAATEGHP